MKTILIPTDFTVASLRYAEQIANAMQDSINICMFHVFAMPDSLVDAMHRLGEDTHNKFITEGLRISCKKVKVNNKNIANIRFKVMYGSTTAAFRNFAEANQIDVIALPEGYRFIPVVRESIDPGHMFRKSGIEILDFAKEEVVSEIIKGQQREHYSSVVARG